MSVAKKVNSPQWKNYQPPSHDPAILSYQRSPNIVNTVITTAPVQTPESPPPTTSSNVRETGYIEKLMHSYGFVQCCEREARLFFHFSEYTGNIGTIKIGDSVEFQLSYDKHTGRPIACAVVKVDPSFVTSEILSEEKFHGTVIQEAKLPKEKNGTVPGSFDGLGRVTYEHSGECFFLPYAVEDIIDSSAKLKPGDQVIFYLATDKRNGNIRARKLDVVKPQGLPKSEGVICSLKDKYGFIERADAVKEIFFHYSEFKGNINDILLGDDVEFSIQNRNGKDVAVNISRLPVGTVIFEDIAVDLTKGEVLKPLKTCSGRRQSDPLGGRILYQNSKGQSELPFGDKDQLGDYTLFNGDIVNFNIATDRRDKLNRATNIVLSEETFTKTSEKRETGTINNLKEGFGFIQCADRDARMFFNFGEILDPHYELKLQDEMEFTVVQDPASPTKQVAIRMKPLPKGSVSFQSLLPGLFIGTVDREPANQKLSAKTDSAKIIYDFDGKIQTITYLTKDILDYRNPPKFGDKVEFNICEQKRNGSKYAVNVKVVLRNVTGRCQGFIAALKENYGFIENAEHEREVFFHYSAFDKDPNELDLGDEVEYTLTKRSSKISAENIHKITKGTIPSEDVLHHFGVIRGKVVRPMRIINPDQEDYYGLVQTKVEGDDDKAEYYPYGITSLVDKRDFLQKGDAVTFQVGITLSGKHRAVNMASVRKFSRAYVDSVKGQYGFLNYEVEDGKKLFFHMTEVLNGNEVQQGDEVEFVIVQNQRNGKYSACNLRKLGESQRPERLVSRLKSITDDGRPKVVVIRQPKGPDGTKGFKQLRIPRVTS